MSKQKNILNADYALSRRITLAYIVKRPIKPWLQAIPGMFIIDFLIRTKEIRKYSQYYMYFRNLAMDIATANINDQNKDDLVSQREDRIIEWLVTQNINHLSIRQAYVSLLDHLVKHYKRLLQSAEDKYRDMIEDAYQTWDKYNEYLSELASIEKSIDQAIREQTDENLHEYYYRLTKQIEADEQRKKELDEIF